VSETKTGPASVWAHEMNGMMPWLPEYDELIPDLDALVTEDGRPVDNFYAEKLYKLLTEPLRASWRPPGHPDRRFLTASNVGWFYAPHEPAVVPDVMVSLDVVPRDPGTSEGRSYFQWVLGKPPDVAIEVVSDNRADEPGEKLRLYERLGLPYYVIHDPFAVYDGGPVRAFELRGRRYAPIDHRWIEQLGLGLTVWQGEYEAVTRDWLRWCDHDGAVLPTGQELAAAQRQRADDERRRADAAEEQNRRLLALLKAHGIDPKE
jgi:Uma2 family endonuclease